MNDEAKKFPEKDSPKSSRNSNQKILQSYEWSPQ